MTSDHERIGRVGCIDGSVLDVSRRSSEVLLAVAGTEIHRSTEAAARLASLLTADASGLATSTREAVDSRQDQTLSGFNACPDGEAPDPGPVPDGRSTPAHLTRPRPLVTTDTKTASATTPLRARAWGRSTQRGTWRRLRVSTQLTDTMPCMNAQPRVGRGAGRRAITGISMRSTVAPSMCATSLTLACSQRASG